MTTKGYVQTILVDISNMDIDSLRLNLKEEYTYQDVPKETFLDGLNSVFSFFKLGRDTHLILYPGVCGSRACENCGKKGYQFVGNKSKRYIDLIFFIEQDDIKDIFFCKYLKTEQEVEGLDASTEAVFSRDQEASFVEPPQYWEHVAQAKTAYYEVFAHPPRQFDIAGFIAWIKKYENLYQQIGPYRSEDPDMRWTNFLKLYRELNQFSSFVEMHHATCLEASKLSEQIKTEDELVEWLLQYEEMGEKASFGLKHCLRKRDGHFSLELDDTIYLKDPKIHNVRPFLRFFEDNFYPMFDKYAVFTRKEIYKLSKHENLKQFGLNVESLRYHIEHRKEQSSLGVSIPFHIDQSPLIEPPF